MPRIRLIYNPTAGREVFIKHLPEILELLERAGFETSCKATEKVGGASEEASKAASDGYEIVIAAGGDGTINEVVNGLAKHPNPPKLAIIPAGTINDFARALKISKNLIKAAAIITNGKTKLVDIGKYQDKFFINVAALGYLTEVSEANSLWKTVAGSFAYYFKILEKLSKITKSFKVKIEADDRVIEEEILLLFVTNSVSVGGFTKFTPDADLSDGLFDVLILKKTTLPHLLHIIALASKGEHINDPRITYFKSAKLKIETVDKLKFNLDGEWIDNSNGTIEIFPKHLEVFIP